MENDRNSDIEEFLNKFIDETPKKLTREEKRFIKYSKKFKEIKEYLQNFKVGSV